MLQLQILLLESRRILDGLELAFDGMSTKEMMGSEVMAREVSDGDNASISLLVSLCGGRDSKVTVGRVSLC
jgi:hypothetical protein